MNYEIDPSFRNSGSRSRWRSRKRILARVAMGPAALGVIVLVVWGVWPGESAQQAGLAPPMPDEDFAMVQTDEGIETRPNRITSASFLNLRRDPMILRFEQTGDTKVTRIAGPSGFIPDRAGAAGPERLSVFKDALFVAERRLITTLPSSRDDFALFQAQRSQALAEDLEPQPMQVMAPVAAGQTVQIEEENSWGSFISNDEAQPQEGAVVEAAVYVETQIENTTSIAVTLRENQRYGVYEDVIVVLQTDRALQEVLQSNGFAPTDAQRITQATARLLGVEGDLMQGGVVALRLRPNPDGRDLMQMSLYSPTGYLATLAQVGAGRFAAAADPWIQDDLLGRSGVIRQEVLTTQDVRLLDALYSSAIRNGLPTNLVGEMIVIMSQRYDLDRFVAEGDKVTILFATEPGVAGQGIAQLLFVGIDGPSGKMPCYVTKSDSASGFGCFDFEAMVAAEAVSGLGGGLVVPVNGVKTSGFGPRHHPILKQVRNHNGVDWAAPTGTPIRAAIAGKINFAGVAGAYGNVVYIDHAGGAQTRYAHMNGFAETVRSGIQVAQGDVIGFVGTTGRSTGPHLHFELYIAGAPVNPLSYSGVSMGGQVGSQAVEVLVDQIIRVESAGNAMAKNPLSSATGLGQFIDSTWLRMMRDYRPDLALTMSQAEQLQLRFDPALSREMVRGLARENESYLRARGHQISAGRLYLAHFLGPAGANSALSANPQATVLEVMGAGVVNANPFLRGLTIFDLHAWADRKMLGARGGAIVAVAPQRAAVPPEVAAYRKTVDEVLAAP